MKERPKLLQPFTEKHVRDRTLVIKMLQYEETQATSQWGQDRYRDPTNRVSISLDNEYAFNRKVLYHFGFDTSDESVTWYRRIFKTYFQNPYNYDKEVIESSYYMRNNRCVFYKEQPIVAGDPLPNCRLYMNDGYTETTLHNAIMSGDVSTKKAIVCAFSNS